LGLEISQDAEIPAFLVGFGMDLACIGHVIKEESQAFMESQDAAATFFYKLWPQLEANKNKIITGAVIVGAAVVIFCFVSWHREQNQIAAGEAMTQNLISVVPNADPKQVATSYLSVADDYPNTPAGERSLLQGAAALFAQGRYTDAQSYFQRFLDGHPDSELSAQAALGVAKCQEAEGKLNDAAGAYQHVINDFADGLSVNNARFSLAQIEMQNGHLTDAFRDFQQVYQADPYGSMGMEAAQYAMQIKSKVPTSSPTTAGSPFNLSH
jgi:TolA-binding protein